MSEIVFEQACVGYGGTPVVSGISFSAEKGEITALIGPNGAGKSTILKTAAGLLPPISGSVRIRDNAVESYAPKELYGIVSVMMTERGRTEFLTCYDAVRIGRYRFTGVFGGLSDADRRAIQESMELIGVWDLKDRDFAALSDGQKQRVLLARAIVSEPGILIMDEPSSFLDMGRKIEFFDALQDLVKTKRIAVLLSMHEMGTVKKVADRVVCVSGDGRIDAVGKAQELITPEYLETLFWIPKGRYREYYEF